MTASQKVHLRRCASSCVIAAYFYVRLIPQDSPALHLELFPVPSSLTASCEILKNDVGKVTYHIIPKLVSFARYF
jgi:hypothetical protein